MKARPTAPRVLNRAATVAVGQTGAPAREWFKVVQNIAAGPAELWIFDEIGMWGVTAGEFVGQLRALKASAIDLHLNSPGGEVFDGIAIYNALRSHPAPVTVNIDGLAASIASVIAMAGDTVIMAPNATMMIHEGHMVAIGDSADMRKAADLLDRCSDNIASIYAQRTGDTADAWRARMKDETWFTAKEAVKAGLADSVAVDAPRNSAVPVTTTWDLSVFNYAGRDKAPDPRLEPAPVRSSAVDGTADSPRSREPRAAAAPSTAMPDMPMSTFSVGDRVQVAGDPHEPEQTTGVVALVVPGPAYGIRFDNPPDPDDDDTDDGVYKWYVGVELEPTSGAAAAQASTAPIFEFDLATLSDLFTTSVHAALDPPPASPFDTDHFRDVLSATAADAPPPPAAPEPLDWAALFAARPIVAADFTAAVTAGTGPVELPPIDAELFRNTMLAVAGSAPIPPTAAAPAAPEPEPVVAIDPADFVRALREAKL